MSATPMPTLYVPNKYDHKHWPHSLTLSDMIQDWLELEEGEVQSLLTVLKADWAAFGEKSKSAVPKKGTVPQVGAADLNSGMFDNYLQVKSSLGKVFDALQKYDVEVKKKVKNSKLSSETAQGYVRDLIEELNIAATTPPQPQMSEDEHVMTYIKAGMDQSLKIMTDANGAQEKEAGGVDDQTALLKSIEARLKKLEAAAKDPSTSSLDPQNVVQPPSTPVGTDPTAVGNSTLPTGLDSLGDSLDNGTSPTGVDNSGLTGQSPSGIGNLGDTSGTTTPTVQPASATSPTGSGMDMMSSMLPMMMQQAMMRNMADQDLNSRRDELDPRRFDDQVAPVVPPAGAPAVAQPAVAQPAVSAPATQHGPTSNAPAQPVAAAGRTPGADGSVVYTFPDGRTQKVSAMVAQALDGAFGNASGTDAQKAYEKTPAKWSDKKQIGARVDPYQLMTGDVATWDKRSAILVVFGSDEGGTLEAVINGALKPFVPEMTDSAGEFGQFSGFAHPKGIELTAPKDGDVPPTTPGTTDQSANAAVPIIAAPA